MMYQVNVINGNSKVFDSIESALEWANRQVVLTEDCRTNGKNALENGKQFGYNYGFSECWIFPVKG